MPLATTAAQNAALDAVVSSLPSPSVWALYVGNPVAGGTEMPATGGYAAATYSAAQWAAAASGVKTATVSFGTSTAAWGDVASYWAVRDAAGVVLLWDLLPSQLTVTAAGVPVSVSPQLFFNA